MSKRWRKSYPVGVANILSFAMTYQQPMSEKFSGLPCKRQPEISTASIF
ncbi:MAG: hypothetical protein WAW46_03530 [Polaromonas sp.]